MAFFNLNAISIKNGFLEHFHLDCTNTVFRIFFSFAVLTAYVPITIRPSLQMAASSGSQYRM